MNKKMKKLKTFVKCLVVIILTAAAAVGGFCVDRSATQPIVHSGTTVKCQVPLFCTTFTTDTQHFLLINADNVTFTAASQGFFVLHKVTGEAITPTQAQPPLGWVYDTYYVFGPTLVSGGKWDVSEGDPTVQITGVTPVTVTEVPTEDRLSNIGFLSGLFGLFIWLLMLTFLSAAHFYKW